MYFVLATITTVGFGDISGRTTSERYECSKFDFNIRIMCIVLMCIGVFSFSFSISSLSSMLSSIDSKNVVLNQKMQTLVQIRKDYNIGFDFYRRLKSALKYDHTMNSAAYFSFLNELPINLKIELS